MSFEANPDGGPLETVENLDGTGGEHSTDSEQPAGGQTGGGSDVENATVDRDGEDKDNEIVPIDLPPELFAIILGWVLKPASSVRRFVVVGSRVLTVARLLLLPFDLSFVGHCPAENAFRNGDRADPDLCTCHRWRPTWARLARVNRLAFQVMAPRIWAHLGYGPTFWTNEALLSNILTVLDRRQDDDHPDHGDPDAKRRCRSRYAQAVTAFRIDRGIMDKSIWRQVLETDPNGPSTASHPSLARFRDLLPTFENLARLEVAKRFFWRARAQELFMAASSLSKIKGIVAGSGGTARWIMEAAEHWPELKLLELTGFETQTLPNNDFLFDRITDAKSLALSNLAHLHIGEAVAQFTSAQFRTILTNVRNLESLDVYWTQPPSDPLDGRYPDAAVIKTLNQLKHLFLRYSINDAGPVSRHAAEPLPPWLPECRRLETLGVHGLRLLQSSLNVLHRTLEAAPGLLAFDISCVLWAADLMLFHKRSPGTWFPSALRRLRIEPLGMLASYGSLGPFLESATSLKELVLYGQVERVDFAELPDRLAQSVECVSVMNVGDSRAPLHDPAQLPAFWRKMLPRLTRFCFRGSSGCVKREWSEEFGLRYLTLPNDVCLVEKWS